jgi:iron complex transport system permease protein
VVVLAVLALGTVTVLVGQPLRALFASPANPESYDVDRMVLLYATLPRLVMAFLAGAALAASGAILQQVLRNPLASPTTLGIDAGARLALTVTTLFVPSLIGFGRDLVALAGSAFTTLLVFFLVRRRDFSALAIVLAGLVIGLYCGAASALLVLVKDRILASLFIWGSGSLSQQSWDPSLALVSRLAIMALPVLLLIRPLSLLDLDDESVRALGLPVTRLRVAAVAVAAALSAFVTSAVGVIGFIGLVAPAIAGLSGARRFAERLWWSTALGGCLLLLTDATLQVVVGAAAEFVPTGAVTAVLGSPLLLLLLPRLKAVARPPAAPSARIAPSMPVAPLMVIGIVVTCLLGAIAVSAGRGPSGEWQISSIAELDHLIAWRLPRMVAAAAAGALLGAAGLVLQRVTGNEMASPEVLGVSAGAILAVTVALFLFGPLDVISRDIAGIAGGLGVLGVLVMLGRRTSFSPEKVLLGGIALSALIDAVVGVLSATGDPRAFILLGWMSGATGGTTVGAALAAGVIAAVLVAVSVVPARWLAILPLGDSPSRALGVSPARARFLLLLLAAVLTAAATPIIGPLTFVGLMAPHIVQSAGVRRPIPSLLGAASAGAGVMVVADWVARTAAYPVQLPTGLVAAMVGTPFLMVLLNRRAVTT